MVEFSVSAARLAVGVLLGQLGLKCIPVTLLRDLRPRLGRRVVHALIIVAVGGFLHGLIVQAFGLLLSGQVTMSGRK